MFIAPLAYQVKCPQCGGDIPFRNLVDKESLAIKTAATSCGNCGSRVTLNRRGFMVFVLAMYAMLIGILLVLVAPMFWSEETQAYLPLPAMLAMIVALVALRLTKMELVKAT
jgi:uncharacterized protein (DUF983 family)